jgi:hypothetical protein
MLMADEKKRYFLNFEVDKEMMGKIDETAKQSKVSRSRQARALIEYGLGIERKPFIPVQRLSFNTPIHEAPGKKSRRRRKAA